MAAGHANRHALRDRARLSSPPVELLAFSVGRPSRRAGPVAQRTRTAPHLAWAYLRSQERLDRRRMILARILLVSHAAALVFGLGGMLIAIPHPELWSSNPLGLAVFAFGMQYAGSAHMVLGAAAMFAFSVAALGWRGTLIFFVLACGLSLSAELIGTGNGYPFGNYEYTSGLGYKVLGRVPFSIPLSWFYMGLACFMLGSGLARRHPVWSVVCGAYLLTAWDLVLDPAMAHPGLALNFWVWHQSGPYFGMPVQNFAGWTATGALFMGLSRWLWRSEPPVISP